MNNIRSVATIIINYNNYIVTKDCLESLKKNEAFEYTYVFIGDNSTDLSQYTELKSYINSDLFLKKNVKLIRINENKGFGSANNYVINSINLEEFKYIFLLNNDTIIIDNHTYKKFINQCEINDCKKILGCQLLNKDLSPQISGGYFPTIRNDLFYLLHFNLLFKNRKYEYVSGANMFFKVDLIREVGLFDDNFFLYFEETDLQYRAISMGYKIDLIRDLSIIHLGGASTGNFNNFSIKNYYISLKKFYRKHFKKINLIFMIFYKYLFNLLEFMILLVLWIIFGMKRNNRIFNKLKWNYYSLINLKFLII